MSQAINIGSAIGDAHSEDDIRQTDVLIIGAGLAGLSTALFANVAFGHGAEQSCT